jgi:hypothetical protein
MYHTYKIHTEPCCGQACLLELLDDRPAQPEKRRRISGEKLVSVCVYFYRSVSYFVAIQEVNR